MMKWRVRREAGSSEQEEVRKSLDVLDRVLAEFDSDDDSWHQYSLDRQANGHRKTTSESDFYRNEVWSDHLPLKHRSNSTDAMHSSAPFTLDQIRKPPVPKRDPATRLSVHENMLFSSSSDISFLKQAKRRSYAEGFNYGPPTKHEWLLPSSSSGRGDEQSLSAYRGQSPNASLSNHTTTILSRAESDNALTRNPAFDCDSDLSIDKSDVQCPVLYLEASSVPPAHMQVQRSPSVAQRRANFEKNLDGSKSPNDFRSKSVPRSLDNSRPLFAKSDQDEPAKGSRESLTDIAEFEGSKSQFSEVPPSESNGEHSSSVMYQNESKMEDASSTSQDYRIRQLNAKFAEIRHLIRTDQIKPLSTPPPSFTAPQPPKPPRKQICKTGNDVMNCSLPCNINRLVAFHDSRSSLASNGYLRKTVEDIPLILPADISNMPQLGFSYSMEEDMSPGPKEILLTSTPQIKRRGKQCADFGSTIKSTFNSSVSSLGYGSSQSDLDLNISDPNRDDGCSEVPVDSLKSLTLPIGMKLAPDYYRERINRTDCGVTNNTCTREQENDELQFRCSSAPPFKLLDDDEKFLNKKSIFGVSKKITKNKSACKNGDSVGKLQTSLDDGVILRRIGNLSGDQFSADFTNNKVAPMEDKKRRSIWRSILRRK